MSSCRETPEPRPAGKDYNSVPLQALSNKVTIRESLSYPLLLFDT